MNIERILSLLAEWFLLWFSYYSETLRKFFILKRWIETILIPNFADEKLAIKLRILLFRLVKCLHEMTLEVQIRWVRVAMVSSSEDNKFEEIVSHSHSVFFSFLFFN